MTAPFISRLQLDSILSFPPGMPTLELQPLNVLIGPNGSGKSNFIDALELLRATPTDLAKAIRAGGGAEEWLSKYARKNPLPAALNVELGLCEITGRPLRYYLVFDAVGGRVEVLYEIVEEMGEYKTANDAFFYYRLENGHPAIRAPAAVLGEARAVRQLERASLAPDQSILAQRKEPDLYPEITWLGRQFSRIQSFREWSFGTRSALRSPQRVDDPADYLMPDSSNLALVLNEIDHHDGRQFNATMKRFLPRYERFSVGLGGGGIQLYIHEEGLKKPVSAARVSDGTLRFMAMLAMLLSPTPPPLLCIEEPELGMHPDVLPLLAELLVDASTRMQIVVTTHSDTLLSAFTEQVESVLVFENNGFGTSIAHLDPQRLAYWLETYPLGEIWRIGEIGGNP